LKFLQEILFILIGRAPVFARTRGQNIADFEQFKNQKNSRIWVVRLRAISREKHNKINKISNYLLVGVKSQILTTFFQDFQI